ncbi:hypothetical protein D3C72_2138070 [compost metagenome]
MAGFVEVLLDALSALVVTLDRFPAVVQVVPVDLSAVGLGDHRRLAGEAQVAGFLRPAAHVGLGNGLVIQCPHQAWQALVGIVAQLDQGLERVCRAGGA